MGLPVVVWLPKYGEWVRCLTVTPTANQRDFTCSLVDYGHKMNVKVDNCCYMDKSFLQWPFLARECKLMGVKPIFGDNFPPKVWEEANTFLFGGHVPGKGNHYIDNPDPNIKLFCRFLELGDERAFVEVSNGNQLDEQTVEPIVIQNHLKKLRLINLDEGYVRLNDGTSFDDSVSQKPGQKPVHKVQEPPVYQPDNTGDGLRSPVRATHGRGGHRNNGFSRGHNRNPGSQTGQKPAQKVPEGLNLEDYKNRLSAKEKTGVDPLSQVSRSLDDAKYVSMKDAMTSHHQPQSYTSSSRSRTGHRNTPQTTVGPAEALTRGTLTPPAQMTPANRNMMQNSRQKSNY